MYSGRVSWPQWKNVMHVTSPIYSISLGKEYWISKPKNRGAVLIQMQTVQQQLLPDVGIPPILLYQFLACNEIFYFRLFPGIVVLRAHNNIHIDFFRVFAKIFEPLKVSPVQWSSVSPVHLSPVSPLHWSSVSLQVNWSPASRFTFIAQVCVIDTLAVTF